MAFTELHRLDNITHETSVTTDMSASLDLFSSKMGSIS